MNTHCKLSVKVLLQDWLISLNIQSLSSLFIGCIFQYLLVSLHILWFIIFLYHYGEGENVAIVTVLALTVVGVGAVGVITVCGTMAFFLL